MYLFKIMLYSILAVFCFFIQLLLKNFVCDMIQYIFLLCDKRVQTNQCAHQAFERFWFAITSRQAFTHFPSPGIGL